MKDPSVEIMWIQIISFTALWKAVVIHMSCNMPKLGHHMKVGLGMEIDASKPNPFSIFQPTRYTIKHTSY